MIDLHVVLRAYTRWRRLVVASPVSLSLLLCAAASTGSAPPRTATQGPDVVDIIDVEPVWSGHPVTFGIVTAGGHQHVAYYDAERRMSVASRALASTRWQIVRLPHRLDWDSHDGVAIAVDSAGHLHVAGNMHNDPLVYLRSARPHDPTTLEPAAMIGEREDEVSYPVFLEGAGGELLFLYRDGASGRGATIANAHDPASRSWRRLLDRPLLEGGRRRSAYLAGPTRGPDGLFHLVWMWRESASGDSNRDLSYARSADLVHWQSAAGRPVELPITPKTRGVVVDPVPPGNGLVAIGFGVGWDARQRAVLTYCRYGERGRSQAFNARWTGERWQVVQASDWEYRWPLDRKGALAHDIVVRPVAVDGEGRLVQWYQHVVLGERGWVLDPETLRPVSTLRRPVATAASRRVESDFPGMEVRDPVFDRQGEHYLRWETLPANRDEPRDPPYPPPSMLRVHRVEGAGDRSPTGVPPPAGVPTPAATSGIEEDAGAEELPGEAAAPAIFGGRGGEGAAAALPVERLERDGAPIGRITVHVGDVFDESEGKRNRRWHRLVNRLHRKTRDQVVERQLLFREGEPFSARLLAESERILRERAYLFDAEIEPVAYRSGAVDVEVRTRDVWTLSGGVGFGREGGENSFELELQDKNFLGTGKEVGIRRRETVDRTSNEVLFRDSNPLGRHAEVELILADNSDGHRYLLHLNRPFYSLETRWSAGLTALSETRTDRIFDRGEVVNRFDVDHEVAELNWGRSPGLVDGRTQRWRLGYTWESLDFAPSLGGSSARDPSEPQEPIPSQPPDDRAFSQAWVDYQLLHDRFVEAQDLDNIARTEDLNLGVRMHTRVGYSTTALGATRDLVIAGIDASRGFQPTPRQLLFAAAFHGARWGSADGYENLIVSGELRYYWRNLGRHALFARLHGDWGKDLDEERPFQLGGDSGLRGYPLRFATGDRRALLTIEQRLFTDWEPLRLAKIGAAVFFDVGRAWYGDGRLEDPGVLRDLGFGLRLSPTRSGKGSVLHVDVAFPLDGDGSIDSVQWLVTTKRSL